MVPQSIIVPVHQRDTLIKGRDDQFLCRLNRFFSWLPLLRKKNEQLYKVSWPRRSYVNVDSAEITEASHALF